MKRTAFFISDGTGITAETFGQSLLAQFPGITFDKLTRPYVDSLDKAHALVRHIDAVAATDGARPLVFDTVVDRDIRKVLAGANALLIDVFSTFLVPLEQELGSRSSYSVGKAHSILDQPHYMERIEAVNFALSNDDGVRTQSYEEADLILLGVSRCGKTPTCLYMAMQFGIRAANYPVTEEDTERPQLPDVLKPHQHKLFGLTIEPERLAAIRNERKPNTRYASFAQCEFEVREVERLFQRENIPYINSTQFSVEEISAKILVDKGIERRVR